MTLQTYTDRKREELDMRTSSNRLITYHAFIIFVSLNVLYYLMGPFNAKTVQCFCIMVLVAPFLYCA